MNTAIALLLAIAPGADQQRQTPVRDSCLARVLVYWEDALADMLLRPTCDSRSGSPKTHLVRKTFEMGIIAGRSSILAYQLGAEAAAVKFGARELAAKLSADRRRTLADGKREIDDFLPRSSDCVSSAVSKAIVAWGGLCAVALATQDRASFTQGFASICQGLKHAGCDDQAAAALAALQAGEDANVSDLNGLIRRTLHAPNNEN